MGTMSSDYKTRRIVTGHDADGRSVIVADELVAGHAFPGGATSFLWGRDDAPTYPDDGSQPAWTEPFPPIGGVRLSYSFFEPGQVEEYDRFVAGAVGGDDPVPGMHRTASLDLDIVVSGQLHMELEDGVTVVLNPGDVVVQNGCRHRWYNAGQERVVLAAVTIGAHSALT